MRRTVSGSVANVMQRNHLALWKSRHYSKLISALLIDILRMFSKLSIPHLSSVIGYRLISV